MKRIELFAFVLLLGVLVESPHSALCAQTPVVSTGGGLAIQFDNDTPIAIPDVGTIASRIDVSGIKGSIAQVTVSFYITHTFDSDLVISLIAPNGTAALLVNQRGRDGEDFGSDCADQSLRTRLDDTAAMTIGTGSAPFVGRFQPETPLAAFSNLSGDDVNGRWLLVISDIEEKDEGILQCWSLFISEASGKDTQ